MSDLKTASVLAFERKLDPSDALLSAGSWGNRDQERSWQPIAIREKSVRGTISNRLKAKDSDPAKLDAQVQNPNLQTIDVATLPHNTDTLRARFTLRVLGEFGRPSACNSAAYQARLQEVTEHYINTFGFSTLAQRYVNNLANARFLWRNRMAAEQIEVRVRVLNKGEQDALFSFDALSYSLREFKEDEQIKALTTLVTDALDGKRHLLLEVTAFARMGAGQEVFPSQELILDRDAHKSRTLYCLDNVAGIHSQKIGNALRTIDTWYPQPDDARDYGPIAIEPYGSITTQGVALRQPKKKPKLDFYNLFDNWLLKNEVPDEEQQHYVMAILIRGGVFGEAG